MPNKLRQKIKYGCGYSDTNHKNMDIKEIKLGIIKFAANVDDYYSSFQPKIK